MQLPAQQTSLEPHPHREDPAGRRPFLSQNTYTGDGSRLASDPGRVQRPRIPDPQTPKVDLNKLPNTYGFAHAANNSANSAGLSLWIGIGGGRRPAARRRDDGGVHRIGWKQSGHVVEPKGGEVGGDVAYLDGAVVARQCFRLEKLDLVQSGNKMGLGREQPD